MDKTPQESIEELKALLKLWMEQCKKLEKENERLKEKLSAFLGY